MATYKVLDIANKIIAATNANEDQGDIISNLKLQKLLYYMQGFHLAAFNTPLFEEDIVAWQYGPVVVSVYEEFKNFGSQAINIDQNKQIISLEPEEEELFNAVFEEYGQFSAIKLMKMTHEEMPWKSTYISSVIKNEILKSYFKTQLEN